MRVFISLSLLVLASLVFAQSTDERLAAQFLENGEYEKASELYKKLHKKNSGSVYIYDNYLKSLLAVNRQKDAEKLVEKQIKRFPSMTTYQVDLGYVYLSFDQKEKAEKYFSKLNKKHIDSKGTVVLLAQSYEKRQLSDNATQVYELGVKKLGPTQLYPQLINSYRRANKAKKLTDFSLKLLSYDQNTLNYIVRSLDIVYQNKESAAYLQRQTLLYAQKNPNNLVYDELLLEVFLQQKKYSNAMRQAIALDKKTNKRGTRVIQLSKVCVNNQEYKTAIDGYKYVIKQGKNEAHYINANSGLIDALYLDATQSIEPDKEEINSLTETINEFVGSQGVNYKTVNSLYRLAELQIFYNNDVSSGIKILNNIIKTPRVRTKFRAKTKLLLGDAYLMQNEIWEAKLLYGQVDKEFKEDALGQEAKFKSAKLSYFTGDFDWAKSQLDILKTATTQLISNNAIELSLLIQDNTGLDSTEDAMIEYASAEFLLYQNDLEGCTRILNMLPFKYPNHTLNDEILFLKANVQEKLRMYEAANKLYTNIYEKYSEDILADNALYRSAEITLHVFDKPKVAQELFEKLVLEYNSSLFVVNARKSYFGLKEGRTKDELFFNGKIN